MNNLTPIFERETGQVILEGPPAGVAGEAPLVPVPGLELAFDRAGGRLCRAVVDAAGPDGPIAVDEQVAPILIRLFGSHAPGVVSGAAAWPWKGPGRAAQGTPMLSPEPELTATLSSLARLDAARATSPVSPASPWWAAEAAELAERADLHARAHAEAHQAVVKLLDQVDRLEALSKRAVRAALAAADINAADNPQAASRLPGRPRQAGPAQPGYRAAGSWVRRGRRSREPGKEPVRVWPASSGCSTSTSCPKGSSSPGCRRIRTSRCGTRARRAG